MVKYTISKYAADPKRVFATGQSSGGVATYVLCGAYPDVFAAGAPISGLEFGCFAGGRGSSPTTGDQACLAGQRIYTPEKWGSMVRAAYPGYTGSYPRMQLWQGTVDTLVRYQNLIEGIKQWSNVLNVSFSHNETNTPKPGYTKMVYGDGTKLVAYSAEGVGHVVPMDESSVLNWFGITV